MRRALASSLIALALAAPATASAWCRMTTSGRQPSPGAPCVLPDPAADPPERFLEWLRPCTGIALSVEATSQDLSDAEVRAILGRSIATWEAVECDGTPVGVDISILDEDSVCVAPFYRDDGGNVNAIMFVDDWAERGNDPAAFALTTVWHRRSTGEILDADMEVNEQRGPYGVCPDAGCVDRRTVDLENVFTHELGHYLGLAHSTEAEATMFASAVDGETLKRDLAADDVEGLCAAYPPGTPTGECDPTPRGGLVLDCEPGGCSVSALGARPGSPGLPLGALPFAALLFATLGLRRRW